MPTLTSNSQIFSASSSEQHATFADFFNEIVVTNNGDKPLWVCTDGTSVTDAEAGSVEVAPGQTAEIANEQIKSYPFAVGAGGDPNSFLTSQKNTPASGNGTYVSFISDSGVTTTLKIVISAQ